MVARVRMRVTVLGKLALQLAANQRVKWMKLCTPSGWRSLPLGRTKCSRIHASRVGDPSNPTQQAGISRAARRGRVMLGRMPRRRSPAGPSQSPKKASVTEGSGRRKFPGFEIPSVLSSTIAKNRAK